MTQTKTFSQTAISPNGESKKLRKPVLCSLLKSSGQTTYRSKGKYLYCLISLSGRYLRDHSLSAVADDSSLYTDNPSESLRFIDQDVAVARVKALAAIGMAVSLKLEFFSYQ